MDNCEPTTTGGDTTIRNGDEQQVLDACVARVPQRAEGAQEQDFH
ncbi:hypothetical protein [Streptomyces sp. t39]|nr:hypothetical protein [Streptomyces sp. t39]